MTPQLLIYTPEITPRIKYSFTLFFSSLLTVSYRITANKEEYDSFKGPKLNYSAALAGKDEIVVRPAGLLTQLSIISQNFTVSEWSALKIFYHTTGGDLPFDIFSASFYLVSRYEEYLPYQSDRHSRFNAENSIAYQNNFLNIPLVNLWAAELKKLMLVKYPQLKFKESNYSFIPTVDIDVAYAHLGRTIGVTAGSYLKLLCGLQIGKIIEKTSVLLGWRNDPFDTYSYQETIFRKYQIAPVYFFLASRSRSDYDRNIKTDGKKFAELVKNISSFAQIGIHPSYYSAGNPEIIGDEVENVERYLTYKITKSRQHFLKVMLPETYRCLFCLNITDDYSLGYAGAPGFRASICTPFPFYDLKAEEPLPVMIHSPVIMDGTLNEYQHLSTGESEAIIEEFAALVKRCGGEFITIWHNHSLGETDGWKGWKGVFEKLIRTGVN